MNIAFPQRPWNVLTLSEESFLRVGRPGSQGRQWRYWRWCGSGGHNPWLSCADWSLRAQPVLGFHPSSWARVFRSPLQSSLKEDSQVESLREAPRTLPLQPHWREASLLQPAWAAGRLWETLATGEHSTSVKESIWQVFWKVLKQCGNSGCCQSGLTCVWLKWWEEIKDKCFQFRKVQTGWGVGSLWSSSPAGRDAKMGAASHPPPPHPPTHTEEVDKFRKGLDSVLIGFFVDLTDRVFLTPGRPQGLNGFLVFLPGHTDGGK